jgi:hypothetical protein
MNEHEIQIAKSLRFRIADCERTALAAQRRLNTALRTRAELAARLAKLEGTSAPVAVEAE